MQLRRSVAFSGMILVLGCKSAEKAPLAAAEEGAAPAKVAAAQPEQAMAVTQPGAPATPAPAKPPAEQAAGSAIVGEPAPGFSLSDLEGKVVRLADLKGKTVVLEWFNPECPFVRASHTKGSLVSTADRHTGSGVVWLAINSGAPGKQGAGREPTLQGRDRFQMKHPILLDESGEVGKRYGAKTTPHMFVIGADGVLAYAGAIDNSPDGEGDSPEGGTLVNYVDQALSALAAKKPVAVASTKPYGCSVKYAN